MSSDQIALRRFVQAADACREITPWTNSEWLCRPDVTPAADKLMLVRANMLPGRCHPFHLHPHREEIIYIIYGCAEQWVGPEHRLLRAGDIAHIPAGMVHATYNPHSEPVIFLAILSPALLPPDQGKDMDPMDVSTQEPWASLRKGLAPCL